MLCLSWAARAASRSLRYGEMSETTVITPASEKSCATSDARRTDSARSSEEKPRSRVRPVRRLSPSTLYTFLRICRRRRRSSALVIVVLPAPDRPVIHRVAPFWPRTLKRLAGGMRQESSLASAEHSMMFFCGRPSINARWRAATVPSSAACAGPGSCGAHANMHRRVSARGTACGERRAGNGGRGNTG